MAEKTIFTKIINRELPAYIVAEDLEHIAFLDIAPIAKGHLLVLPKESGDDLFDIEDQRLGPLLQFTKKVAKAMKRALSCKRVGMMVVGMEIPHAHIHLIPINQEEEMDLHRPKLSLSTQEMEQVAIAIHKEII